MLDSKNSYLQFNLESSMAENLPTNSIICCDCEEVLKDFPDNCIDLIFTSPPYIDLEEYSKILGLKGWRKLIQNIFSYAEGSLSLGGHLILNILESLKQQISIELNL